jgi:hypothetical protein
MTLSRPRVVMMTASLLTPKCLSSYYRVAVYDHLAALVVRSRPQLDDPLPAVREKFALRAVREKQRFFRIWWPWCMFRALMHAYCRGSGEKGPLVPRSGADRP